MLFLNYLNLCFLRYPEVTPKHEVNEEGQAAFPGHTTKAAEHLYAIIDGKPKEVLGTTYSHIKEIITTVHGCGYFDKTLNDAVVPELEEEVVVVQEEVLEVVEPAAEAHVSYAMPAPLPAAPAPAVVPAPAYPLRPLPPITLQEVEHAYFAQQYPQQRPISEVIGSQNFFFLQESEIDSPAGTPQPPMLAQPSPPGPIPTQTFTNQHFVRVPEPGALPLPPHFQHPEHAFAGVPLAAPLPAPLAAPLPPPHGTPHSLPHTPPQATPQTPQLPPEHEPQPEEHKTPPPVDHKNDEEWKESPEREEGGERKTQGQGDGQNRFRRYGRGGGGGRGAPNGYRGRGGFRQNDGYGGRHGEYQRNKDGYQSRQYSDSYPRHGKDYHGRGGDNYYGNGDAGDQHENGTRDRYSDNQNYQGGFKSRGRGGPRGGTRPAPRAPRPNYNRNKQDNVE